MEREIIKFPNSGQTLLVVNLVFQFVEGFTVEKAETLCALLQRARLEIDGETIATVRGADLHSLWCRVPDPRTKKMDPFTLPLPVVPPKGIVMSPERDVRLYVTMTENAPNLVNVRGNFYTSGPPPK
jgi:hypothetical protein